MDSGRKKGASSKERVDAVQVRPSAVAVLLRDERVGCYADLHEARAACAGVRRALDLTPSTQRTA